MLRNNMDSQSDILQLDRIMFDILKSVRSDKLAFNEKHIPAVVEIQHWASCAKGVERASERDCTILDI